MWNKACVCLGFLAGVFVCVWPLAAASTLSVTSVGTGIDALTTLSGGNLNRTLAIIEIDSLVAEAPNGFSLRIHSLNGGQLVRKLGPSSYADTVIAGNVADYTFSLVSGAGTLGMTAPSLPTDHPLSTDIVLDFSQNVSADTVDKQYACVFTIPAKTALFSGTFGDVLTFTLTDL